jgi:hypothetical protein
MLLLSILLATFLWIENLQLDRERKRSYAYQQEIRMLKEQSISVVRCVV